MFKVKSRLSPLIISQYFNITDMIQYRHSVAEQRSRVRFHYSASIVSSVLESRSSM